MTPTPEDPLASRGAEAFSNPEIVESRLSMMRRMTNLLDDLYQGKFKPEFDMRAWIHEKASGVANAATDLANAEFPKTPERKTGTWISPKETPWIKEMAVCPFCGSPRLRVTFCDNQRIDAYCDSADCDARDLVVLVLKDGHVGQADKRPDVQKLQSK